MRVNFWNLSTREKLAAILKFCMEKFLKAESHEASLVILKYNLVKNISQLFFKTKYV